MNLFNGRIPDKQVVSLIFMETGKSNDAIHKLSGHISRGYDSLSPAIQCPEIKHLFDHTDEYELIDGYWTHNSLKEDK